MLSLLLLIASKPQSDPAARFESYMAKAKTLSVNLEFTVTGSKDIGRGSFHLKKPGFVLFNMKWGASDYSFSIGPTTSVAVERGEKLYREYGDVGRLFMPDTDISNTPAHSFPLALMAGTLHALAPNGVQTTASGRATIDGTPVDIASAQYDTQTAKIFLRTKIDATGRALEFEKEMRSGAGQSFLVKVKVSDYKTNHELANDFFETTLPVGFVPQTLPADAYPLNVGEAMPLSGWKPLGTGKELASIAASKTLFLAVSDPDCAVSTASASTIADLSKKIEGKGGAAAAISVSSATSQTPVYKSLPYFIDPSGKLLNQLRMPGTPMFFLVSPKGIVTRVWYGYDQAIADKFEKDVLEWIDRPPTPSDSN